MTFLEYITRKTGLGRTHWFWAIVIHVGFAAFCAMGIYWLIADNEWWHIATFGIPIVGTVAFWIYTWKNWKTDKAREEAGPANPHYSDIAENSNPPQMTGGGPITNIVWWFAATRHCTRDEALQFIEWSASNGTLQYVQEEHAAYLSQFKNK